MVNDDSSGSSSSPGTLDANDKCKTQGTLRLRMGIEVGRWFVGSSGDIYELVEPVGSGSASTVFKCKRAIPVGSGSQNVSSSSSRIQGDASIEGQPEVLAAKVIDLKTLKLNPNFEEERNKLRREAQYLQSLPHPCIVKFVDYVEAPDAIFLVQEYVHGGELFYKVVEKGCFSEQQACFIAHQMLAAITYMHSHHIIHSVCTTNQTRDIKPENILVEDEEEDGFYKIKIADFGLAKMLTHSGSYAKSLVGTPQYWAPEGGTYPFDSAAGSLQELVLNGRFHFRHSRFSRVSEDAKNLIRQALVVDPSNRISLEKIFFHPWMTRWLSEPDRSRLGVPSLTNGVAFHFMPPLPPLCPSNAIYPPLKWRRSSHDAETNRSSDTSRSSTTEGVDHSDERSGRCTNKMQRDQSSEIFTDSQCRDSDVSVCFLLPGFVLGSNTPVPPFHLPVLLPLQLHVLLAIHLLLLALRQSPSILVLAQELQHDLWVLQQAVHRAVGVFECTSTSAIEIFEDLIAACDTISKDDSSDSTFVLIEELFTQVRKWICEMQKQGEILGMRYDRAQSGVGKLSRCILTVINTASGTSSTELGQTKVGASREMFIPGEFGETDPPSPPKDNTPLERHPSDGDEGADSKSSLCKEASAAPNEQYSENAPESSHGELFGVCSDTNMSGTARMEMLRDYLSVQLNRLMCGCMDPSTAPDMPHKTYLSDIDQVEAGIEAWKRVGAVDPSMVTREILDVLFLSSESAAYHARQMFSGVNAKVAQYPITPSFLANASDGDTCLDRALRNQSQQVSGPEKAASCRVSTIGGDETSPLGKGALDVSELPASLEEGVLGKQRSDSTREISSKECNSLVSGTDIIPNNLNAMAGSSGHTEFEANIAASRLNVKSLEKLRQLSYNLVCISGFWSNFDVILSRLLQLQQHSQALLKHAQSSWLRPRARQRLVMLKDCWIKFRTQCRIYLELAKVRDARLLDLGLHMQLRADQFDAIRALRPVS